ncbi:MAG: hypothetical protein IH624_09820 [Phycisphaerae bacterium]|nr:hypothetical protein [Phycisphaerae bacterium]
MQRIILALALMGVLIGTSGCIVAIGNDGRSRDCGADCRPVYDNAAVIAEIDAAAKLFSDRDKADVYKGIARRPQLSGKAQTHLVKSAMRSIFSDASKEEVLLVLIENPCFDDAGKKAVLSNLNTLFSDSRKKRILTAINAREMKASAIQMETTVDVTAQTMIK